MRAVYGTMIFNFVDSDAAEELEVGELHEIECNWIKRRGVGYGLSW